MKTGSLGTFVISESQTEVNGQKDAPLDVLSVGATWRWSGTAVRVDGSEPLLLEEAGEAAEILKRTTRMVRRLVDVAIGRDEEVSTAKVAEVPLDPGFIVTDGDHSFTVTILSVPTTKARLLILVGELPPVDQDLSVKEVSTSFARRGNNDLGDDWSTQVPGLATDSVGALTTDSLQPVFGERDLDAAKEDAFSSVTMPLFDFLSDSGNNNDGNSQPIWLVQYRHENEREFEQDMRPGVVKSWKVTPYAPDRVTREAREGDMVVIWRTVDRQAPESRQKSNGGIVGWGRLRLSGRPATSPTVRFEVTHAFPDRPIDRSDVHQALGLDKAVAARWPGMVSLRRLIGAEAATIAAFRPPETVINRSDHPLASGIAPNWASGWGEDENGVFVEITVGEATQALRWCPPGRFLMGSPEDEALRGDNEGPQIEITFEQGFWLFDTPVTEALYEAVTGDTPPAALGGPDMPVRRILHSSAEQFIKRINAISPGLELRLPSEAEWEYACRAGSITPFEPTVARTHAGTSITLTEVNYDANEPDAEVPKGNSPVEVVDVKSRPFRPNAWGLWQMHGNVCELCADVWHNTHVGASADGKARQAVTGEDEKKRAIRGGSWLSPASLSRSARRFGQQLASIHLPNTGFRPARSQVSGTQAGREGNAERSIEMRKTELPAERAGGAVQAAIRKWFSEGNDGRGEIQFEIRSQIEAISPDVEANATSGSVDLWPWAPELRSIDWPEDERITVSEVVAANGNTVKAVFNVPVTLLLNLSIEMNFSHWDSTDKEELSMGGRTEDVEREEDVVVTCTVEISDEGGEDEYVELIEAEIDLKGLFVDLGEVDVFLPEDRDYDHEETSGDAKAEISLGYGALKIGLLEDAKIHFHEAMALYEKQDNQHGMATCLEQMGGISLRQGDLEKAEAKFVEALTRYQNIGNPDGTAEAFRQLAGIAKDRRDLQKAHALYVQATDIYESVRDYNGMIMCLNQLSEIEKLLGNSELAARWLTRSLQVEKPEDDSSK